MRLFLNGLAANAGAGLTYIRNVVTHLSATAELQTTVALSPSLRKELGNPPNISFVEIEAQQARKRFWQEQTELVELVRHHQADVLISAGNFAVRRSPVPQILLSGNSLYTSRDFYHDLRTRREYRMWLDTRIRGFFAKHSVHWADRTVAPSQAFAAELRQWTGSPNVINIYHGFDHDAFCHNETALPVVIAQKLDSDAAALRILFVSHYTYYRNFETLLRALPTLQRRLGSRKVKLFLTCTLSPGANPGSYRTESVAGLIRQLGIANQVIELGAIPYYSLFQVYRACHIYVTAAYAETFAHPLVEAMASGLPVVASNLAVHREICGQAAVYFERFAPEELADRILQVASSPEVAASLAAKGSDRARDFSWSGHVQKIVSLAANLVHEQTGKQLGEPTG